jgi:hypothetical protein
MNPQLTGNSLSVFFAQTAKYSEPPDTHLTESSILAAPKSLSKQAQSTKIKKSLDPDKSQKRSICNFNIL